MGPLHQIVTPYEDGSSELVTTVFPLLEQGANGRCGGGSDGWHLQWEARWVVRRHDLSGVISWCALVMMCDRPVIGNYGASWLEGGVGWSPG